jgi:hypothetical protein
MAKSTETAKDQIPNSAGASDDFDYSKYMPEGHDAKDLRKIGGLTPIYNGNFALDQKWPPCCGWLDRIERIEIADPNDPNPIRDFMRVELTHPTKGVRGPRGANQEIVDLKAGEDILLPMSGNFKNVAVLRAALANPKEVFFGIFRAVGHMNTGKPSDMVQFDQRISQKTKPRDGRFALPANAVYAPELQTTQVPVVPGQVYDANGKPVARVVG